MGIQFDPYQEPAIDMVDLGLSFLIARGNIGATNGDTAESWYGNYYAWGEVETKSVYLADTYKFGASSPFSKYDTDGKTILESVDDVVTVTYGSDYRMPTQAELTELKALPNQWVENYNGVSGLNGQIFTGTNGNTVFIPAAGYYYNTVISNIGHWCSVWSSSLNLNNHSNAYYLEIGSSYIDVYSNSRYFGYSVRAIKPAN